MKLSRAAAEIATLAVLTLAAYANTLGAPLFFDDRPNIVTNAAIHSFSNFTSLARLLDAATYAENMKYAVAVRPVAYFTFALNYAIGGDRAFGYHVVNLAIHLATVLLVFALTRALVAMPSFGIRGTAAEPAYRWAPFLAAALFACHPVQTQAVTYITQRFASLAALFYVAAVLCYVRSRSGGASLLRWAALVLSLLAQMTKELSATLPIVLLGFELVYFASGLRAAVRRVWPFFVTVAVIPMLMWYASRRAGTASFQDFVARGQDVASPLDYFATQMTVLVMYVRRLVWPTGLNFDYDYPLYRSFLAPRVVASTVFLVALSGAALLLIAHGRKRLSGGVVTAGFGVLWFVVTSAVESSFVPLADLAEEYRCYLPSVGFVWTIVFGVLVLVERRPSVVRRAALVGLCGAVLALTIATHRRNAVFRDEVALWEDTVAKSPLKARPHTNLSVAYANAGRQEDSILQYQAAAFLNPEFRRAHGRVGIDQRQFDDVMRRAAAPFVQGHLANGIAALGTGDMASAEAEFRVALKLDPESPEAHTNLAYVHAMRRDFDAAVRENKEAVRFAPNRSDVLRNLGLALAWRGDKAEALDVLRRAAEIDPGDAESNTIIEQLSAPKAIIAPPPPPPPPPR